MSQSMCGWFLENAGVIKSVVEEVQSSWNWLSRWKKAVFIKSGD